MNNSSGRPEVLVSIDIEATGRIPWPYSMISLGAVAFTEAGEELSRFKINLKELPGSEREEYVMKWWGKQSPDAWRAATENAIEPEQAMREFRDWLRSLPGNPKLIGWPLMTDFMFVYWYYMTFFGEEPPFGYDGGYDTKTAAAITLGVRHIEVSRTMVRERFGIVGREFTHDALDDALQQAELFFVLKKGYNELRELQYLRFGMTAVGSLMILGGAWGFVSPFMNMGTNLFPPHWFGVSITWGIFMVIAGWRGWFLKPKRK